MKKKIVYLIAGLMIAATMSAAMVGCDSGNETTSSQTTSTTSKTESKTESKAESTGATFTSSDKSYSFTVPEGFTETEVPTGTLPAGSTGAAFTNADNIILVTAKTDTGSPSLDGVTEDTVKNQMEALYPGAKISNFATEKKGEGNVFKYKMDATVQGLSISIVQSTYTDAKRTINFSITSNDGSKIDDKIVKVVDDAMASLEIK